AAAQSFANLRSAGIRSAEAGAARVGPDDATRVDNDHSGPEVGSGPAGKLLQLSRSVHPARGARGDDEGLRGGVVLHLSLDPAREVQREWHLERHDDQQEDVREGGEETQ